MSQQNDHTKEQNKFSNEKTSELKESDSKVQEFTFWKKLANSFVNLALYGLVSLPFIVLFTYFANPLYFILLLLPASLLVLDYLFVCKYHQFISYKILKIKFETDSISSQFTMWYFLVWLFSIITLGFFSLVLIYINYTSKRTFIERKCNFKKIII